MSERAQEFTGKVKINEQFYKGYDAYSDGEIEDRLLEIARNGGNYEEKLLEENEWALLYHLSPIRCFHEPHPAGNVVQAVSYMLGAVSHAGKEKTGPDIRFKKHPGCGRRKCQKCGKTQHIENPVSVIRELR